MNPLGVKFCKFRRFQALICLLLSLVLHTALPSCAGESSRSSYWIPEPEAALQRIALGSCNHQNKEHLAVWEPILDEKPDLFVWLGDIVYSDPTLLLARLAAQPFQIQESYDKLKAQPGYQKLASQVPIRGIWDDHDMGKNDGDTYYKHKDVSKKMLLDFLDEPKSSPRWTQPGGGYAAYVFGPVGQQVKLILLDTRYNQDHGRQEMLGDTQWEWLERELWENAANITIIGSSIQVVNTKGPSSENWQRFPAERRRLFDLLTRTSLATGTSVLIVSGDVHLTEIASTQYCIPHHTTPSSSSETRPETLPKTLQVSSQDGAAGSAARDLEASADADASVDGKEEDIDIFGQQVGSSDEVRARFATELRGALEARNITVAEVPSPPLACLWIFDFTTSGMTHSVKSQVPLPFLQDIVDFLMRWSDPMPPQDPKYSGMYLDRNYAVLDILWAQDVSSHASEDQGSHTSEGQGSQTSEDQGSHTREQHADVAQHGDTVGASIILVAKNENGVTVLKSELGLHEIRSRVVEDVSGLRQEYLYELRGRGTVSKSVLTPTVLKLIVLGCMGLMSVVAAVLLHVLLSLVVKSVRGRGYRVPAGSVVGDGVRPS